MWSEQMEHITTYQIRVQEQFGWGLLLPIFKKTGGTRYINGYTAVCARAVTNPYEKKAYTAKKAYEKKAKQLKNIKTNKRN